MLRRKLLRQEIWLIFAKMVAHHLDIYLLDLVIDSVDHSRSMIAFSILVFWLEFSFLLI
jgi:hypothetical protein